MIDLLQGLDRWLLVAANSRHLHWLDGLMVFFSERFVWFPAYFVIVVVLGYYLQRRALIALPLLGIVVALADSISSRLFKPYFARLRPCHDPEVSATLNLVHGCGGQFGFLSSHAANSFALAIFLCIILPRRFRIAKVILFIWAALVSYSRIYLGAHYPSDVAAGALLGSVLAWVAAIIYERIAVRVPPTLQNMHSNA